MRGRKCPYCFKSLKNTAQISVLKWKSQFTVKCPSCSTKVQSISKKTFSYFIVCLSIAILVLFIFLLPFFGLAVAVLFLPYDIPEIFLNLAILLSLVSAFLIADYLRARLLNIWNWKYGDLIITAASKEAQVFD